jgi:DNA primase
VLPLMIDGRQARFLFLPEGEDPDTLVRREGTQAFHDRITCASPLSEFLFEQAATGRDLERVEDRERYASQVLAAIARLPEGVLKSLMLGELSRRTGVDQTRFEALLARADAPTASAREAAPAAEVAPLLRGETSPGRSGSLGLVARVLQLLVHEPGLVSQLPEGDDWCPQEDSDGRLCREVIRLLRAGRYRSAQVLLAHFHGTEEGERLAVLARRELLIPRGARGAELDGLAAHFVQHQRRRSPREEIDALLAREKAGDRLSREEKQRLMVLLTELRD